MRRPDRRVGDWTPDPSTFFDGYGGHGGGGGGSFGMDFADDFLGAIAAIVALVVAGLLFWWIVLPALLLVLDVIIVAVLTVAGLLARVLLHRPWTVEVNSQDGRRFTRQVVGWRNAQAAISDASAELRNGASPVLQASPITTR